MDTAEPSIPESLSAGDANGPDRAILLSGEQLRVGTVRVPIGRVRLEKFQVVETRTITVEVIREEVRLIPDIGAPVFLKIEDADGSDDEAITARDAGRWIILHQEEVTVSKRSVPVERVRLETFWTTHDKQVSASVRTERVGLDNPSRPSGAQ